MDDRFLLCSPTEGISTYNRFLQTEREAKRQRSDQYRDYPEHRDVIMVAEGLRKWAFEGSWAVCAVCRGAHRAKLDPTHFLKDDGKAVWDAVQRGLSIQDKWPNIMKTCSFCAGDYYVPRFTDFSLLCHGITDDILHALRPIHIFNGPPTYGKTGFRRHVQMTVLRWSPADVLAKIDKLPPTSRRKARLLNEWLMENPDSSYCTFVEEHRAAFREDTVSRALPFSFLLRPYIETALWPHLYPNNSLCDTNMSGRERKYKSVKQAFLAKVCSEVLDYALRYDLLQFHYDRHVLSHFSEVGQRATGIPLERVLKEFPDSPHDLKMNRAALADLNRQLGRARFLVTLAPGAYATTWSYFVERTRHMAGRRVLGDNTLEALHVINVLDQLCRGYLTKSNIPHERVQCPWIVFDHARARSCVQAWAYRLEFQDGMTLGQPGAAHRPYHGTGMPHAHVIFWCTPDIQETRLLDWLRADLASEFPPLARCVTRLQLLRDPVPTGLPLCENSTWQEGNLHLRHTGEDEAAGVFPYLSPLCLSEVCHTNVTEVTNVAGVTSYMT